MNTKAPSNIDDYISLQAPEVQPLLKKVRETILDAAPGLKSTSATYALIQIQGPNLVYFAAHKNHLGFYATPSGNIAFSEELKDYKSSKGAVQFPLDRPIPYDLIRRMVQYKLEEIMASSTKKRI